MKIEPLDKSLFVTTLNISMLRAFKRMTQIGRFRKIKHLGSSSDFKRIVNTYLKIK